MRPTLLALAVALLLATTGCAAAGGAPKDAPANATPAPSFMPTPTGGQQPDPYGY